MSDQLKRIAKLFDRDHYKSLSATMPFGDYLELCLKNPKLGRNAWQIIYDMILEKGSSQFEEYRKTYTRYNFFDDPEIPVVGVTETKDALVKFIKGAAGHYGTERRVLLLHGPVGSAKSTICSLLKRGLERYSRTDAGAWYSYKWVNLPTGSDGIYTNTECEAALHENPLKLLPTGTNAEGVDVRKEFLKEMNAAHLEMVPPEQRADLYELRCEGELNPRCKFFMNELLKRYDGDLEKVLVNHITIVRKVYSEIDRCGIGTFQPKDEKNQDSTELTGDINFRLISQFGSDADPRSFDFSGEFCSSNRGMIEFIEMLKLDVAFLYDLLGASQEHSIKPKKFSQINIDEAIIGHSVHGDTPIPHEYDGVLDVLPISEMADLDFNRLRVFSVNPETREVELNHVRRVFSHNFEGVWVENHQGDDVVTTTPNHSVYGMDYETFYPGDDETSEILTIEIPDWLVAEQPKTGRWMKFFANSPEGAVL